MSQIPGNDFEDDNTMDNPTRSPTAQPFGSRMPDNVRAKTRAVLAAGTDVAVLVQESENVFIMREIATNTLTNITSPGMAELYLARLRGEKAGGPI